MHGGSDCFAEGAPKLFHDLVAVEPIDRRREFVAVVRQRCCGDDDRLELMQNILTETNTMPWEFK